MAHADRQSAIGLLLRVHRQRRDLTIERLAEASGVSVRTISDIERGVSAGPHPRTTAALADALLLGGAERAEFAAAARAGRPGTTPSDPILSSRPNRAADFSGRTYERALLTSLLLDTHGATTPHAAIVVSGPPGVGKTTLALEGLNDAGHERTLFVDLQGFEVAALTPLQILQSLLRQVSGGNAEFLTLGDASVAWRGLRAESPLVVLLDNASSEIQVRTVLATDADLHVVVTSRRTLAGLEGARRIILGPLTREESIELLRRSVREDQEAAGDLDEIARYCADLPLALRIAGARIASRPQWTVEDYANRLRREDGRIGHLVAGDLNIESTFALSYAALDVESRELFRSLALLRGSSFSARMASAIHSSNQEDFVDLLDGLVDLGLVEGLVGDRYRLHDLLRIFAGDRMKRESTQASVSAMRDRLQNWILETARCAARSYSDDARSTGAQGYRPDPLARKWLLAEAEYWIDAIHGAARRAAHEQVSGLVVTLLDFSDREVAGVDWWTLLELATTSARSLGPSATLAKLLHARSDWQLRTRGDVEIARASAQEAVDMAETIGDDLELARALIALSAAVGHEGPTAASEVLAARGLEILRKLGELDLEVDARRMLLAAMNVSDGSAVRVESRRLVSMLGTTTLRPITRLLALNIIARSLVAAAAWDEALIVSERFVGEAALFTDEPDFLARAYRHRGLTELALGMDDRARIDLQAAVGIARTFAPAWWSAEIDEALARLDSREGGRHRATTSEQQGP